MSADNINKLVIIASSTGGPKALHKVIPGLSKRLDAPVIIVQHMPKGFTSTLAERLNHVSDILVTEAVHNEVLEKGHVYLTKGGTHLLLMNNQDGKIVIREDCSEPVNGLRPCADVTYSSILQLRIPHIVNVVLTGMGCDGCEGIATLNEQQKTYTIAQHKDTCVVYGMPKAIVDHDMADVILPLEKIGAEITRKVGVF
ncbi:MAG: chemotaxis protein CheB [Lachnospiraceae bacterium]|nr:chemotaxis protein CheB [Lachnospiraceae bacterium]